jgi:Kef-type K+ transport system membrane component KefB
LLFFLAGLELDLDLIRGRPLTLAIAGWFLSLGLALVLSGLLYTVDFVHAPLLVAAVLPGGAWHAGVPLLA